MRLEKQIDRIGHFSWNGEPNLTGNLIIERDGEINLKITKPDDLPPINFASEQIKEIKGKIEGYEYAILKDCFLENSETHLKGVTAKNLSVTEAILSNIEISENQLYSSIIFTADLLEEWLGICQFISNYNKEKRFGQIKFKIPDSDSYKLDNGVNIKIGFNIEGFDFAPQTSLDMRSRAYIEISNESPSSLEELRRKMYIFLCFLYISTDVPISINRLYASPYIENPNDEAAEWCEIYCKTPHRTDKPLIRSRFNMLIDYRSIKDSSSMDFNKIVYNFYNLYERVSPALDNIVEPKVMVESSLYDWKLLSIMRGVETFQRFFEDSNGTHPDEEMINSIIEICDEKQSEFLKKIKENISGKSLQQKTKDFIKRLPSEVVTSGDRKSLSYRLVNRRHTLTHSKKSLTVSESFENYYYYESIYAISALVILREIGVTDQAIINIVKRNTAGIRKRINAFRTEAAQID